MGKKDSHFDKFISQMVGIHAPHPPHTHPLIFLVCFFLCEAQAVLMTRRKHLQQQHPLPSQPPVDILDLWFPHITQPPWDVFYLFIPLWSAFSSLGLGEAGHQQRLRHFIYTIIGN